MTYSLTKVFCYKMAAVDKLSNAILSDVLCFLTSARNTLTSDQIILNATAFFKDESIIKSKEMLFEIAGERPIKRKACQSQPNPAVANLDDMLQLLEKLEDKSFQLPSFVVNNYMSLPPNAGFEGLASVMCSLRDELASLRSEVSELRKFNEKDARALGNVESIIQDVSEIKTLIQHISSSNNAGSYVRPTRVNEIIQEHAQAQNLTQNSVHQDENEIHQQGAELQQNVSSAENMANQASEEFSAPEINPTSQVQLYSQAVQSSPNGPTTGRAEVAQQSGSGFSHAIRGGRNGSRRGGYDGAGPAGGGRGGFMVRGRGVSHGSASNGNFRGVNRQSNNRVPRSIHGTNTNVTRITSAQRMLDLFVSGCSLNTNEGDITSLCDSNDIAVESCTILDTRRQWCRCFKLTIAANDRDKLMNEEIWPMGIYVQKYFSPRRSAQGSQMNQN